MSNFGNFLPSVSVIEEPEWSHRLKIKHNEKKYIIFNSVGNSMYSAFVNTDTVKQKGQNWRFKRETDGKIITIFKPIENKKILCFNVNRYDLEVYSPDKNLVGFIKLKWNSRKLIHKVYNKEHHILLTLSTRYSENCDDQTSYTLSYAALNSIAEKWFQSEPNSHYGNCVGWRYCSDFSFNPSKKDLLKCAVFLMEYTNL